MGGHFRNNASALKMKPTGMPRSVHTSDNVKNVCVSVLKIPNRSTRKQFAALGVSKISLQQITFWFEFPLI